MSPHPLYASDESRDYLRALMRSLTNQDLSDEAADAANRAMQIFLLSTWLRITRSADQIPNSLQLDPKSQMKLQEIIEELQGDQARYPDSPVA